MRYADYDFIFTYKFSSCTNGPEKILGMIDEMKSIFPDICDFLNAYGINIYGTNTLNYRSS